MIAASQHISQKKRECKNDVGVYYRYKLEWANLCYHVCVCVPFNSSTFANKARQ